MTIEMTSEHDKLDELFHAALEISSQDDRRKFLDQKCVDSPLLRQQVERLLNSHDSSLSFLEQSPTLSDAPTGETPDPMRTRPPRKSTRPATEAGSRLPRRFGDYELLEKIDQGGMGVVYKARQSSLNRIVAMKMILSGQFAGDGEVQRFYVEAEAAGKIDHSGIVPVYDVGCEQGQHYFSMAFVNGQSLAAKIKEGPLDPRDAANLTRKIAQAIQAAHDQGIVHRDLKPGNVLLDERGEPRVTDFGLAKRVEGDSKLTTTGMVLGTPSYMPPEQASGKNIDASADIYSLGAILYAMLTGRPPFECESQLETILSVIQDEPVSPRRIDKKIPKDLEVICLKCLEKASGDRYRSATELSADLKRFVSGEPIHARNDLKRRFRKWSIREPVLAAHLMATLVLLTILLVNYFIWRENSQGVAHNFRLLKSNIAILLGSALAVFVLQKAQNMLQSKVLIHLAWAAINPICLTIVLCNNDPPREWLLSVYFLLIVPICFFRRVELVATTTVVSLLGYLVLLMFYIEVPVASYQVVFGVTLASTGTLLCLLTHQLKRLGEQSTA